MSSRQVLAALVVSAALLCTDGVQQGPATNNSLADAEALYSPAAASDCAARFRASGPVSILMVADAGTLSGTGEATFLLDLLHDNLTAPSDAIPCQSMSTGSILGHSVVVVTTGIGPETAALCVVYILECASSNVKEIIYQGTAGWTPQVGGALNAASGQPGCSQGSAREPSDLIRIGDVAITPFSVNWDCKKASWSEQCGGFPNQCFYPVEDSDAPPGPTVETLYGRCIFSTRTAASTALADELYAATRTAQFAANALALQGHFNSSILPFETDYFGATTAGIGSKYPQLPAWVAPTVYNSTTAVEIDGSFFFSGVPWDMVARNYSALALNRANNSTLPQADVFAVNAEEGVGVSAALDSHNTRYGAHQIPYTFVRGCSDYLYPAPMETSPGVWGANPKSPADHFNVTYPFAVRTISSVVLTVFQLRCRAAGNSAADCGYILPPH